VNNVFVQIKFMFSCLLK